MPKRIQRKRTKGWRMPEGAIYVGRPTMWGNPFPKSDPDALAKYERHVKDSLYLMPNWLDGLAKHDLACWCPLDSPCHVDVLLQHIERKIYVD